MSDGAHAGEDVGVFATGPGSNLVQGAFEQSFIPYVVSFSMCLGPVGNENPFCKKSRRKATSKAVNLKAFGLIFVVSLSLLHLL
jgi:hypothetical protein